MMNYWLKEIKEAKRIMRHARVILYQGSCETLIPESSRPVSHVIEYSFSELGRTSTITGFYLVDVSGFVIYNIRFDYEIKIKDGDTVKVDLGKLKVNNKWYLEQLIPEKDYC